MSMRLPCPFCGARDYTEFTYGGDADVHRPADPGGANDDDWAAYLYLRRNARGAHREWWQHSGGCRRWIVVMRDTVTHAVVADAAPAEAGDR